MEQIPNNPVSSSSAHSNNHHHDHDHDHDHLHIVVVGAGMAGLIAAKELLNFFSSPSSNSTPSSSPPLKVTIVETNNYILHQF